MRIAVVSALFLSACSSRETKTETDESGFKIEYQVDKKTKVKDGVQKKYNADGKLWEEANYKLGKLEGERRLYFPNGGIMRIETYKDDKFDGPFYEYYENGKKSQEGKFVADGREGEWKYYYASGQVKLVMNYLNGLEDGPFEEYHENGQYKAKGTFKVGVNRFGLDNTETDNFEHGELLLYDERGELEKKLQCEYGICETLWQKDTLQPAE